jgi:putative endonuclease
MERGGCVYIVANRSRTVYYIGVTADLSHRAYEHKHGDGSTFTKKYCCTDLIYYEAFPRIEEAIAREKKLKKWHRAWKDELVRKMNPTLRDLYDEVRSW